MKNEDTSTKAAQIRGALAGKAEAARIIRGEDFIAVYSALRDAALKAYTEAESIRKATADVGKGLDNKARALFAQYNTLLFDSLHAAKTAAYARGNVLNLAADAASFAHRFGLSLDSVKCYSSGDREHWRTVAIFPRSAFQSLESEARRAAFDKFLTDKLASRENFDLNDSEKIEAEAGIRAVCDAAIDATDYRAYSGEAGQSYASTPFAYVQGSRVVVSWFGGLNI
jgi:hypothetical protein